MIKTKQYLERVHGFNVIGGYLSPTHDEYVRGKLGEELISGQHRIEICQKAIEEANQQHWLSVDKAECMAPNFISLGQVTLSLKMFINTVLNLPKPVRVIYIAGLDLFNRCHGMHRLRTPDRDGVAVVYRSGEEEHLVRSVQSPHLDKVYYVKNDSTDNEISALSDISSTQIRRMLKDGQSCEHLTYPSVLNYLKLIPLEKK
ncbi:unnamed protein product [Rotaria sordida]|uniref:Nicotinamide-nucleotide adenylyltransferase n=1 Tax=Rotaria sordida TaxID=392033 RepID=A0A815UB28_9BILA|nr:unnamed protein product [Rotaria sordida]CAF1660954.1 unnamed protein product [Rotaria sordida]